MNCWRLILLKNTTKDSKKTIEEQGVIFKISNPHNKEYAIVRPDKDKDKQKTNRYRCDIFLIIKEPVLEVFVELKRTFDLKAYRQLADTICDLSQQKKGKRLAFIVFKKNSYPKASTTTMKNAQFRMRKETGITPKRCKSPYEYEIDSPPSSHP